MEDIRDSLLTGKTGWTSQGIHAISGTTITSAGSSGSGVFLYGVNTQPRQNKYVRYITIETLGITRAIYDTGAYKNVKFIYDIPCRLTTTNVLKYGTKSYPNKFAIGVDNNNTLYTINGAYQLEKGFQVLPIKNATDGLPTTYPNPVDIAISKDIYVATQQQIHRVSQKPCVTLFKPITANRMICDSSGNIYVSTLNTIIKIDAIGNQTTLISGLKNPNGMVIKNDILYVVETGANRVGQISVNGGAYTIYYTGYEGYKLNQPKGICLDTNNNIIVVDVNGCYRLKIDTITSRGPATIGQFDGNEVDFIVEAGLNISLVRNLECRPPNDDSTGLWATAWSYISNNMMLFSTYFNEIGISGGSVTSPSMLVDRDDIWRTVPAVIGLDRYKRELYFISWVADHARRRLPYNSPEFLHMGMNPIRKVKIPNVILSSDYKLPCSRISNDSTGSDDDMRNWLKYGALNDNLKICSDSIFKSFCFINYDTTNNGVLSPWNTIIAARKMFFTTNFIFLHAFDRIYIRIRDTLKWDVWYRNNGDLTGNIEICEGKNFVRFNNGVPEYTYNLYLVSGRVLSKTNRLKNRYQYELAEVLYMGQAPPTWGGGGKEPSATELKAMLNLLENLEINDGKVNQAAESDIMERVESPFNRQMIIDIAKNNSNKAATAVKILRILFEIDSAKKCFTAAEKDEIKTIFQREGGVLRDD